MATRAATPRAATPRAPAAAAPAPPPATTGAATSANATEATDTRQRILDVALDLFIENGYDKTSLREIAEGLGFTKAALYYHFASKEDILKALHLRVHEFGTEALSQIGSHQPSVARWGELLAQMVDEMLDNRKILLLHQRNPAAFEALHREDVHEASHGDLQDQLRRVFNDTGLALRDRVRLAAAFGAVTAGIFMAGDAFDAVPTEDLGDILRDALRDMLG